jgi:hypothetical protein
VRFLGTEPPGRSEDFSILYRQVKKTMRSEEDTLIEVTEGVDDLCIPCPDLGDGKCINPFGAEDKVRKWDSRILDGLGLSYGERKSAGAIRDLIGRKAPLGFCRERCPWKSICTVFGRKP